MSFFYGYLLGLAFIIFIGPVVFTLIKATLSYGKPSGFAVALGIFLSDVVAVLLCNLGAEKFLTNSENQSYIGMGGAIILLFMGIKYLIRPTPPKEKELNLKNGQLLNFFTQGFLVNFVNPFVFLVWISVISGASEFLGEEGSMPIFLTGSLLGILTTDSLKVLLADRIKVLIQPRLLKRVFIVFGVIMIGFGVRLIIAFWPGGLI